MSNYAARCEHCHCNHSLRFYTTDEVEVCAYAFEPRHRSATEYCGLNRNSIEVNLQPRVTSDEAESIQNDEHEHRLRRQRRGDGGEREGTQRKNWSSYLTQAHAQASLWSPRRGRSDQTHRQLTSTAVWNTVPHCFTFCDTEMKHLAERSLCEKLGDERNDAFCYPRAPISHLHCEANYPVQEE